MGIRCQALDNAYYNKQNLNEGDEFILDEKFLKPDANGDKTITPRWCIPLDPIVVPKPEVPKQAAPKKTATKKTKTKKPDIFI